MLKNYQNLENLPSFKNRWECKFYFLFYENLLYFLHFLFLGNLSIWVSLKNAIIIIIIKNY